MKEFTVRTVKRDQMIDITGLVREAVNGVNAQTGTAVVYVPHTTAGVTINENADPSVQRDILAALDRMIPFRTDYYEHLEGNSAAHVKASLMGASQTVLIEEGRLCLGTWQGIYFCEFDGPRVRKFFVRVTP